MERVEAGAGAVKNKAEEVGHRTQYELEKASVSPSFEFALLSPLATKNAIKNSLLVLSSCFVCGPLPTSSGQSLGLYARLVFN